MALAIVIMVSLTGFKIIRRFIHDAFVRTCPEIQNEAGGCMLNAEGSVP